MYGGNEAYKLLPGESERERRIRLREYERRRLSEIAQQNILGKNSNEYMNYYNEKNINENDIYNENDVFLYY